VAVLPQLKMPLLRKLIASMLVGDEIVPPFTNNDCVACTVSGNIVKLHKNKHASNFASSHPVDLKNAGFIDSVV
jgi:hypothetical protein